MAYRESDAEFDDGGTPAWRARHRVIDVAAAGDGGFRYRLRRMKLHHIVILALFFGLALPWLILFGGMTLMAVLGINPG